MLFPSLNAGTSPHSSPRLSPISVLCDPRAWCGRLAHNSLVQSSLVLTAERQVLSSDFLSKNPERTSDTEHGWYPLFFFFLNIQYYFVSVSGVQHSGQKSHALQSVPPDISSAHLAPHVDNHDIIDSVSQAVLHIPVTIL